MHLYLTKEGLESIAADYRRQMSEAENFNGIRRAEGAAMAIEHILKEVYDQAVVESTENAKAE